MNIFSFSEVKMESMDIIPVEKKDHAESNEQALQQKVQLQQEEIKKYLNIVNDLNAEIEDLKNKLKTKTEKCEKLTKDKAKRDKIINLVKQSYNLKEEIQKNLNELKSSENDKRYQELLKKYSI